MASARLRWFRLSDGPAHGADLSKRYKSLILEFARRRGRRVRRAPVGGILLVGKGQPAGKARGKMAAMSEDNKAILRRISDEVFSQGNLDVVDELFAPNYVLHDPGVPGGELRGIESFKQQWVSMFRTAF